MAESTHLHAALWGFFADPQNGWFPPFTEAVAGQTAAQACWAPAEGMNRFWAITNHVRFWHEVVLHQLQGLPVDRKAPGAENGWPRLVPRRKTPGTRSGTGQILLTRRLQGAWTVDWRERLKLRTEP